MYNSKRYMEMPIASLTFMFSSISTRPAGAGRDMPPKLHEAEGEP